MQTDAVYFFQITKNEILADICNINCEKLAVTENSW